MYNITFQGTPTNSAYSLPNHPSANDVFMGVLVWCRLTSDNKNWTL